ncbi:Uu.00g092240.m01.CDS01 [Anthostomella pinea]|uniref:Uu.00g092240.m01.CDS01 n=1 Tax=Anthostomella pinea TaxID=933095 RepID=A0AAI8VNB5_9PEZI|nr:Uu.00g092240.m01.CDS01 [Anthostomella pinea]
MFLDSVLPKKKQCWSGAGSCIGRRIQTQRTGRSTAWFAIGDAQKVFDETLVPEIRSLLDAAGVVYPGVHLRLYMVGSREEKASPTIMVCCEDPSVRKHIKASIQESKLLHGHPGFRLGSSALPLEAPVPPTRLADDEAASSHGRQQTCPTVDEAESINIYSLLSNTGSIVGSRFIAKKNFSQDFIRAATAGVVWQIDHDFYQFTVGHICDPREDNSTNGGWDLEECDLGLSEDEEYGHDNDLLPAGSEITSRGSRSTSPSSSRNDTASPSPTESASSGSRAGLELQLWTGGRHYDTPISTPGDGDSKPSRVGAIKLRSTDSPSSALDLDYALVLLDPAADLDYLDHATINQICYTRSGSKQFMNVSRPAPIPDTEVDVLIATSSGGVQDGTLLPSTDYHLQESPAGSCRKTHVVLVDGSVVEGDCGAVVINAQTGELYGHIVSGCAGTSIAYIVPGSDIFEDISARFGFLLDGDLIQVSRGADEEDWEELLSRTSASEQVDWAERSTVLSITSHADADVSVPRPRLTVRRDHAHPSWVYATSSPALPVVYRWLIDVEEPSQSSQPHSHTTLSLSRKYQHLTDAVMSYRVSPNTVGFMIAIVQVFIQTPPQDHILWLRFAELIITIMEDFWNKAMVIDNAAITLMVLRAFNEILDALLEGSPHPSPMFATAKTLWLERLTDSRRSSSSAGTISRGEAEEVPDQSASDSGRQ